MKSQSDKKLRPKGKRNAYMFFNMNMRDTVKNELGEHASGKQVTEEVSLRFKSLTADEKSKYIEMAEKDKLRFIKQQESYELKGFWVDDSTDEQISEVKKKPIEKISSQLSNHPKFDVDMGGLKRGNYKKNDKTKVEDSESDSDSCSCCFCTSRKRKSEI